MMDLLPSESWSFMRFMQLTIKSGFIKILHDGLIFASYETQL